MNQCHLWQHRSKFIIFAVDHRVFEHVRHSDWVRKYYIGQTINLNHFDRI